MDWGGLLFPGGDLTIEDPVAHLSHMAALEVNGRPAFAYVDSVLQDVVFVLRF